MISHMNQKLSSRMIWDIVAWSDDEFSFKKTEYILRTLKYKLIAQCRVVASHHWPGGRRHFEWVMWCVGIT